MSSLKIDKIKKAVCYVRKGVPKTEAKQTVLNRIISPGNVLVKKEEINNNILNKLADYFEKQFKKNNKTYIEHVKELYDNAIKNISGASSNLKTKEIEFIK